MVGVDEAQGVESAPLGVAGAGAGRVLRQVGLHQGQRLLLVAPKQKSMLNDRYGNVPYPIMWRTRIRDPGFGAFLTLKSGIRKG
jgi:hypothetical protein